MKKSICILLILVLSLSCTVFSAGPSIESVTCTAREDGLNDVTVVVNAGSTNQELTLLILGNDDNKLGQMVTVDGKTGYIYYMLQANNGSSLQYTFNFTMAIPETMTDIEDYIYVFSGNFDAYTVSQIAKFNYDVTFSIGEHGTVKIGEETITDKMKKTVSSGNILDISIIPDAGYVIKSATCKGAGMIEYSDGVYSTSVIGEDTDVVIEFTEDTSEPDLIGYNEAYYENEYTSIVFATLTNTNLKYTLKTYGVVAGKQESVKLGDNGSFNLEKKVPANKEGQYGIRIVDNLSNEFLGKNYFVIPYAIYNDGKEDITFYGDAVEVNFDNYGEEIQ
ncbi:MAG: hypothetical protein E7419_06870 [Ruminococcaceae bacterium]|nr:hypothetical protein [Oscillospiraceae bacterium]